ncbi:MAG TPA: hypothetical protein VHT95_07980 [Vicinamibacterales bacterium]|nr:hypothetical protein [Vicinamibacterales bacterium]
MLRNSVRALLLVAVTATAAGAQTVQTDPLQCWWRTSAGAVRVGEPFTLVLTCAVIETDDATVVVDQTRLEPSVVQFAPYETLGGSHGADLRTDQRRFFQYEYRLRLIADGMFGRDVALPEMKLSYRVQTKVGQKTSLQGRDQSYVMPAQSMRILSLVPSDAADIRDTSASDTFSDIDQRAFRANLLTVIGSVFFVLAALMSVLGLVRLFQRYRKPAAAASERLISDRAILAGVGRELAAVQHDRDAGSWTPEIASRAIGALRVAATYAIGRPVSQMPASRLLADGSETLEPGRLILKAGWPRGKRIAVSGAVTSQTIARVLAQPGNTAARAARLETVSRALAAFTAATFSRDGKLDDSALDEALATSKTLLSRMKFEQLWFMKRLAIRRAGTPMDNRVWSR